MVKRELEEVIKKDMFRGKVVVLLGPRQVGKTTLVEKLLAERGGKVVRFNGDDPFQRQKLGGLGLVELKALVAEAEVVFVDEAQKIAGVGEVAKLLVDHYREKKQVVLTGSSSLRVSQGTGEALTGRQFRYRLYPLSWREVVEYEGQLAAEQKLEELLIYGGYPEVYLAKGRDEKERLLRMIYESYLFRDVLELAEIRRKQVLTKLLEALALQIGKQVSMRKLAEIVGADAKTVERYIDLLEESYVVFRLRPFFRNKRKSLRKMNKIYFYDVGIRNVVLNDFRSLRLRGDVGELWENWLIGERMKWWEYRQQGVKQYFWRGYGGAEVDYVEERNGRLRGVEIKWQKSKGKASKHWLELGGEYRVVNRDNFREWIGEG